MFRLAKTWQETMIPVVAIGSAQHLGSRPLYVQELDAQGLLCAACGFELGEGVVLVGTPESYRIRPCSTCALYRYEQSKGVR